MALKYTTQTSTNLRQPSFNSNTGQWMSEYDHNGGLAQRLLGQSDLLPLLFKESIWDKKIRDGGRSGTRTNWTFTNTIPIGTGGVHVSFIVNDGRDLSNRSGSGRANVCRWFTARCKWREGAAPHDTKRVCQSVPNYALSEGRVRLMPNGLRARSQVTKLTPTSIGYRPKTSV